MSNTFNKTKVVLAVASFIAAIVFGAVGAFVTPPPGSIDGSLLIMIAQCFILSATFLGFRVDFDLQKQKFKTEHEDDNSDDKQKQDSEV